MTEEKGSDLQPNWRNILIAYNALTCVAIFLIVLGLLPPLFSKRVHRRTPWYSHMLSWLVMACTLLLMIGHQRDAQPPAGLCFVQSALLYATPPLNAFSMACYLLDINLAINGLLNNKEVRKRKLETSIILALFPWIIFWAVIIEVSIVFSLAGDNFKPSGDAELHLFCHYNSRLTNTISASLVIIAAVILILVKGWMISFLIRKFKTYEWSSARVSQMVLSAFIRTVIFIGVALVGIIIGLLSCSIKSDDAAWSLILPLLPIIAAVVYGIHMDVFHCYMFWRKVQDPTEEDEQKQDLPASRDEEAGFTDPRTKDDASGGVIIETPGA